MYILWTESKSSPCYSFMARSRSPLWTPLKPELGLWLWLKKEAQWDVDFQKLTSSKRGKVRNVKPWWDRRPGTTTLVFMAFHHTLAWPREDAGKCWCSVHLRQTKLESAHQHSVHTVLLSLTCTWVTVSSGRWLWPLTWGSSVTTTRTEGYTNYSDTGDMIWECATLNIFRQAGIFLCSWGAVGCDLSLYYSGSWEVPMNICWLCSALWSGIWMLILEPANQWCFCHDENCNRLLTEGILSRHLISLESLYCF